ncbi:MAG: hypothetical protein CM1200mP30_32970 [Pseudomonadota bacterium]|nr:MAG: hypothetical protein CM1200mP30_32970 [Pseudomonadota bacterium]
MPFQLVKYNLSKSGKFLKENYYMTTILSVRKGNFVVMAGDGQVSMQNPNHEAICPKIAQHL